MGIAQRVINSGARGAVAAMAMTGTRSLTGSLGLMSETPPEAVLHQQVPGLMAKIPKSKQPAVVELAHWTFGVVAGAGYAMLPATIRLARAEVKVPATAQFEPGGALEPFRRRTVRPPRRRQGQPARRPKPADHVEHRTEGQSSQAR